MSVTPSIAAAVLGCVVVFGAGAATWGIWKYRVLAQKYERTSGELKALQGRIGRGIVQ